MSYYKFLNANQIGQHSQKRLPIGEWITIDGPLLMCRNGIHVTTIENAMEWLDERAHRVEIRGEHLIGDVKVCCREVFIHPAIPEWNEQTRCLFTADCAERVLHLFEEAHPNDDRPRKAIEAARAFARGEITDAAGTAAGTAARVAAWAAAEAAAGTAARVAAWAAARAAAWDAAGDAAWAAARAADLAAGAAARAAAGDAAGDAAGAAERRWQADRLAEILEARTR